MDSRLGRRVLGTLARTSPGALAVAAAAVALLAPSAAASTTLRQIPAEEVPTSTAPPPVSPISPPLRVEDPSAYRAGKQRAERRYRQFEQRQAAVPGAAPSPPQTSAVPRTSIFNGLNEPGLDASTEEVTPPDTTGAIGPNDYLEIVNSEIARYSRITLASPPLESMHENSFAGSVDGTCDGQIQWDQQGQRWLYVALDCEAAPGTQTLYFGWSKTPSPELAPSNWCRYYASTGHILEDFPKLGHDNTQILVGTNAFEDEGEEEYVGSSLLVMNKPAAGVTTCPSLSVGVAGAEFTPVPANIADSSARGYVIAEEDLSHLVLYEVGRNGGGENAILGVRRVTVPEFDFPAQVPQPGGAYPIDSSDTRLTQAVATTDPATGEEGIWTQHTVAGPGGGPSVVSWYELSPGKTTPRQSGAVAGTGGAFAFNGAISPAGDGEDAGLIYNTGNASHLVDLRAQDRHGGTSPGAMSEEVSLGTSVAADEDFSCFYDEVCRWGDYAGASPDPSQAKVVWGTGELTTLHADFLEDPQWGSRNVALDVAVPPEPEPEPSPTPTPPPPNGSGGSTSGSSPSPPSPSPGPIARRRPRCKKGFKKRKVHGKAKCVRIKHRHHRHKKRHHR